MMDISHKLGRKCFLSMMGSAFLGSFGWYFTVIGPFIAWGLSCVIAKLLNLDIPSTIVAVFSTIQIGLFFYYLKSEIEDCLSVERASIEKEKASIEEERERLQGEHAAQLSHLNSKEKKLRLLLESNSPFKDTATMCAEAESMIFADSANYLRYKRHPARSAADEVKLMKNKYNQALKQAKEAYYKYEYILSAFPEIREYVDNDEELLSVGEYFSYSEIEELRDRRKDYLSEEEYWALSEDQKSQLALDRYVANRSKSKWQIGRDYEMCCAFHLMRDGYNVEMHGIKYKKSDLGRDLIAIKNIGGLMGDEVLIVQCKNWSSEHEIHENVIMQLFGTAIEYQITKDKCINQEVVAVLMLPPYSKVSNMAMNFAKKLKIRIDRVPFSDFPRIKCNINGGQKIYHLPFDQQYDRTEIKLRGEFFAKTVAEAVSHGFRRAKRHVVYNN